MTSSNQLSLAKATEIHRVSTNSPCVSSDNESERSFNLGHVACISDNDDREPLATEEEAVRYNGDMEREAEIEEEYRRRYKGKLNKDTWCDIYIVIFNHPYCCIKFL